MEPKERPELSIDCPLYYYTVKSSFFRKILLAHWAVALLVAAPWPLYGFLVQIIAT